uniref:BTB domain-containing protein n=1 Tax=Pyricularia oryzae (strain P131) TaxID=1143193 RepID=L7J7V7_PYRO1
MATDHLSALMSVMREKNKYTDLVVKVGKDMDEFNLHRAVVCGQSIYFDLYCSDSSKASHKFCKRQEAETGVIGLPDVEPAPFKVLVDYLYTGKLKLPTLSRFPRKHNYLSLMGTPSPFRQTLVQNVEKSATIRPVDAYQHISAQEEYKYFSPEELRLADYSRGWRGPKASIPQKRRETADVGCTAVGGLPNKRPHVSSPAHVNDQPQQITDISNVSPDSPSADGPPLPAQPHGAQLGLTTLAITNPFLDAPTIPFRTNKQTSLASHIIPESHLPNPRATCQTMLFALRVYILADQFQIPKLQALCREQYQESINAAEKDIMWRWDRFGDVVQCVFENKQLEALKNPLLRLVIKKRKIHIFWESLEELMDEIPGFERGLLEALRQATLPGETDLLPVE